MQWILIVSMFFGLGAPRKVAASAGGLHAAGFVAGASGGWCRLAAFGRYPPSPETCTETQIHWKAGIALISIFLAWGSSGVPANIDFPFRQTSHLLTLLMAFQDSHCCRIPGWVRHVHTGGLHLLLCCKVPRDCGQASSGPGCPKCEASRVRPIGHRLVASSVSPSLPRDLRRD